MANVTSETPTPKDPTISKTEALARDSVEVTMRKNIYTSRGRWRDMSPEDRKAFVNTMSLLVSETITAFSGRLNSTNIENFLLQLKTTHNGVDPLKVLAESTSSNLAQQAFSLHIYKIFFANALKAAGRPQNLARELGTLRLKQPQITF